MDSNQELIKVFNSIMDRLEKLENRVQSLQKCNEMNTQMDLLLFERQLTLGQKYKFYKNCRFIFCGRVCEVLETFPTNITVDSLLASFPDKIKFLN